MKLKKILSVICVTLLLAMIIAPVNVLARTDPDITLRSPVIDADATSWDRSEGNPDFAFDGDDSTFWHTLWNLDAAMNDDNWPIEDPESAEGDYPQILIGEFDGVHEFDCIGYMSRSFSGSHNGTVLEYEFWVSETGSVADLATDDGWKKIASGTWDESDDEFENQEFRYVKFDAVKAKAVKLKVLDGVGGWACCAELEFNFLDIAGYTPMAGFNPNAASAWKAPDYKIGDGSTIINAVDFDAGTYFESNASDGNHEARPDEEVQTEIGDGSSEFGGNIGWTQVDEWVQYTVNVDKAGKYNFKAYLASGADAAGQVTISFNDAVIGTTASEDTDGWQAFDWYNVGDIELPAGKGVIKVEFVTDGGKTNIAAIDVTLLEAAAAPEPEPDAAPPADDNAGDGETPAENVDDTEATTKAPAGDDDGIPMILWIVIGGAAVVVIVIIIIVVTKKKK